MKRFLLTLILALLIIAGVAYGGSWLVINETKDLVAGEMVGDTYTETITLDELTAQGNASGLSLPNGPFDCILVLGAGLNPDGTPRRRPVRRPAPNAQRPESNDGNETSAVPTAAPDSADTDKDAQVDKNIIPVPNPDAPMIDLVRAEKEADDSRASGDDIPSENKIEQI